MKIVAPSVELLWITENPEQMIELAGRTCYKSEDKITSESSGKFVKMLTKSGHHAMLEHAVASFRIITDRGISHEIVRHRIASYAQECVSGDTEVVAYRPLHTFTRSQKKWSIQQLFNWQSDPKRKGRLKLIRLRSVDKNNRIVPGEIDEIISSGKKLLYKVTCKSGRVIKATGKHKFMTQTGFKCLEELSVKTRVYANGIPALDNEAWLREKYLKENNTLAEMAVLCGCCTTYVTKALRRFDINKPLSMRKNRQPGRGKKGMFSQEQRQEISDRMKRENNPSWRGNNLTKSGGYARVNREITPDVCWGCGTSNNVERHHIDENPSNPDEGNILFLCQKCHKAFHLGQGVLTVFLDEITSIEPIGHEPTFDIIMKTSPHNYVANGFVVHNSTRYCNYSKDKFNYECSFIQPPGLSAKSSRLWKISCSNDEWVYMGMLKDGCTPELARSVLPTCLKTEIIITANLREFRHIITLRSSMAAHPQIRPIANKILEILMQYAPNMFKDLLIKKEENIMTKAYESPLTETVENDGVFTTKTFSKQVGGSHKIQPYEFFYQNNIPYHKAAIIHKILQYDLPTGKGVEDLDKIIHECQLIKELIEGSTK
jgi:thymidylate synthase (FAD)